MHRAPTLAEERRCLLGVTAPGMSRILGHGALCPYAKMGWRPALAAYASFLNLYPILRTVSMKVRVGASILLRTLLMWTSTVLSPPK